MSSHLNGENWTKVEVVWLRAKLNQWKICVGHYEKMGKWLPHHGNLSYRKIFNYWPRPPKFGSLLFQCWWKWNIGICHYEKNGCHVMETCHTAKFPITDPQKFVSLLFRVLTQMENWHWALWKKWKMATNSWNLLHRKFPIKKGYY